MCPLLKQRKKVEVPCFGGLQGIEQPDRSFEVSQVSPRVASMASMDGVPTMQWPCTYREGDIDKDGLLYRTCRLYVGPVVIRCKDWICVEPRACPSKNDGLGPRRRRP